MVQYLGEISNIWDELSEKARTDLLEKLFGKRGASVGSAILGNFDQVEKALYEMENSAGAADAEMEIIKDSLDYKINELKETWTGIFQDLLDRGVVQDFIDALINLSNVVGEIVGKLGAGGTVATLTSIYLIFKNFSTLKPLLSDGFSSIIKGISDTIAYEKALASAEGIALTSTQALGAGMSSLGKTIAATGSSFLAAGGWITIVVAAVAAAVVAYKKFGNTVENAEKKIEKAKKSLEDEEDKLSDLNSELDSTREKIDELAGKESLTIIEKDELQTLKEENAELERNIKLQEIRAKSSKKSYLSTISENYNKKRTKYNIVEGESGQKYVADIKDIEADIRNLGKYYDEYTEGMSDDKKKEYDESLEKSKDKYQKTLDDKINSYLEYAEELEGYLQDFETIGYENLDDVQKKAYNSIASDINTIYSSALSSGDYYETIKGDIFSSTGFADLENKISDLYKSGKAPKDIIENLTKEEYEKLNETCNRYEYKISELLANMYIDATAGISHKVESSISSELNSISLDSIYDSISKFKTAKSDLSDAISQFNSSGTISYDTLNNLKTSFPDINKALDRTANGYKINSEELAKLNSEQKKSIESNLSNKQSELISKYEQSSLKLAGYRKELSENNKLTETAKNTLSQLISERESECSSIMEEIGYLDALNMEYENSISKHNAFINALSSDDEGKGYEDVTSGIKQVQEAWDSGFVGKDEIRTFVDYMSAKDMSTASIDEITSAYQDAINAANKFFTEDDSGSRAFLDMLSKTKDASGEFLATVDDAGNWTINIKDIAQASTECGYSIDFLQDNLKRLKDYGFDIDWSDNTVINDYDKTLTKINNELKSLKIAYDKGAISLDEYNKRFEDLNNTKIEIEASIETPDVDSAISNITTAIEQIQNLQEEINKIQYTSGASTAVIEMQKQQNQIANSAGITVEDAIHTTVDANTDPAQAEFEAFKKIIENENITSKVTIEALDYKFNQKMNEIEKNPYTAEVVLDVNTSTVTSKLANVAKQVSNIVSKDSEAFGSAHLVGSAYSSGKDWTTHVNGESLVGELGEEILVRGGRYYTVGSNGAEFIDVKPNDIIFNHKQSEQLLKYGHINSRGKAYSSGTGNAFYTNTGASGGGKFVDSDKSTTTTSKNSSKDKDSSTDKDTKNLLDWIERKVNAISKSLERVSTLAENALASVPSITAEVKKGFQGISDYAKKLIDSVYSQKSKKSESLMNTYSSAYNTYSKKASKFKLGSGYKKLVREGKLDIDTIDDDKYYTYSKKNGVVKSSKGAKGAIKGDKLREKISTYQDWWDKAQEALDNFISQAQEFYNIPLDKAAGKVEMLADAIDLFDKQLNNTYVTYKDGVANYSKANDIINDKITRQEQQLKARETAVTETSKNLKDAYNNSYIKGKVTYGEQIDTSKMKEGSKQYKAAIKYNAAVVANTNAIKEQQIAQEELITSTREAKKAIFDNIAKAYEVGITKLGYDFNAIDRKIADVEARGDTLSGNYYKSQKQIVEKQNNIAKKELAELQKSLKNIDEGSDEYYDALEKIDSKKGEIADNQVKLYDLTNKITELIFNMVENIRANIDRFTKENDFLAGLVRGETTDKNTGTYTEAGLAQLGVAYANSIAYKNKVDEDEKLYNMLNNMLKSGKLKDGDMEFDSINDLKAKINEVSDNWKSDIQSIYDEESKLIDLRKQELQTERDMYQDRVNKQKEALKAEKDLHSYQKQIAEKTKSINQIQTQIAAYRGDTSQEAQSKLLKLQSDLINAKDDLAETEYERNLQMQEEMLDGLMEEYNERLEVLLNENNVLLEQAKVAAENNRNNTSDILKALTDKDGVAEGYKTEFNSAFGKEGTISKNVDKICNEIVKDETDKKDAADKAASSTTTTNTTSTKEKSAADSLKNGTPAGGNNNLKKGYTDPSFETDDSNTKKKKALDFIYSNLKNHEKKKKEYSDFNKAVWGITNGKVLSEANLKKLAELLGVKYNNAKKSGNLYKEMQKLGIAGFAHGGIVDYVKKNGDDGVATLKVGEAVLTPVQTDMFSKFVDGLPEITSTMKTINKLSSIPLNNTNNTIDYGGVDFNITVNNPTDGNAIVTEIQNNQKLQKAIQSVSVDRLNGSGRLSVNRIK